VIDLLPVSLLLSLVRARHAARHEQAMKVHRNARRREAKHLGLGGRVAGRKEEAEAHGSSHGRAV
jgi:hypothetical protein